MKGEINLVNPFQSNGDIPGFVIVRFGFVVEVNPGSKGNSTTKLSELGTGSNREE
jgi:hypothetical protein